MKYLFFQWLILSVVGYHFYIDDPNREYIPRSVYETVGNHTVETGVHEITPNSEVNDKYVIEIDAKGYKELKG